MQTMASNLAKPKRGETTHIRRCFWDFLKHFPTSNVKSGGTVCKLGQIYHFFNVFCRKIVKNTRHLTFFEKDIICRNVLNTMWPIGAKSVEKLRRSYLKTEKKSEKSIFRVKFDLWLRGCKASFYRKTTWQAFIFYQKKSFKQHTSEIGGGRCNCLVSWRGISQTRLKHVS